MQDPESEGGEQLLMHCLNKFITVQYHTKQTCVFCNIWETSSYEDCSVLVDSFRVSVSETEQFMCLTLS